jgi:cholesterol oxidase
MTAAEHSTLEFTEEMKGYVAFGEEDYERGFAQGKDSRTFLMFHLTISMDDVERFISDPDHRGAATGWVECEELGGRLTVEKGIFNLFVDSEDPARKRMLYRLFFEDGAGHPLTLSGFKDVHDDPGFDLWRDTSTLYTRILQGHVDEDADARAPVVAAGIITIYMLDFVQQLTTFRVGGPSLDARRDALVGFGKLFLGKLWNVYGGRIEETAGDASRS